MYNQIISRPLAEGMPFFRVSFISIYKRYLFIYLFIYIYIYIYIYNVNNKPLKFK